MTCTFSPQVIKEQVHKEFRAAFDELERASGQEKIEAAARLNRPFADCSISSVMARCR
jgi:hypothetical protein